MDLVKSRHSLAHILAQAVQRTIDPNAKLGIGPSIENGFYYDFIFSDGIEFKEENLKDLNKFMQKITKENQKFVKINTDYKQAKEIIEIMGQDFKVELLDEFKSQGESVFSFYINFIPIVATETLLKDSKFEYKNKYQKITEFAIDHKLITKDYFVTFIDMCEGPHIQNGNEINCDAFKLEKIAGAYRRGSEKNPMMTRIYGLSFESKDDLKKYIEMMEEAKKRDHRVLGKQLGIYFLDEEIGAGLPMWLPNGSIIAEELERLAKEKEYEYGYQRVRTPHITKESLYLKSGHLPYYAESMFPPMEIDGEKYYLKPMNCPHHHKIYAAQPKSYRDLPIRFAEYGHCYRYEDSGSLMGLMRVRSMCMNDAHIYCTEEQFEEEFIKVVQLYLYYFKLFGIEKYQMRLSKYGKEGLGKKYVDNEPLWIKTQDQIRNVMLKNKIPFIEVENEAAFYGPKIDVEVWSAIGREFSLATNQLDFAVPERFGLTYIDKDGKEKTPLCIHRAPLGTHERFIGFLIEHYAGAFPLWLAPEQFKIIPVAEKFIKYADQIFNKLKDNGFRTSVDDDDDSFSKKIRNAELMKIPYILIVGEKEESEGTVSVRVYKNKEQLTMDVNKFIEEKLQEVKDRK